MPAKNYKLMENMDWAQPVLRKVAPNAPEIQATWRAFVANIDRADALTAGFPLIVAAIQTYDRAHSYTMTEFFRRGIRHPTQEHLNTAHIVAVGEVRLLGEYMLRYGDGYRGPDPYADAIPSAYGLIEWAAVGHGNLEPMLDAMLGAQIVNVWTAFEAVAEDLWNVLLDSRPIIIQTRRRRALQSLRGIREAYDEVFGAGDIYFSNLLAIDDIEALAAVRNLLVHAGGTVDAPFVQKYAFLPAELRLPISEKLSFDGALVYKMTVPVITACLRLIDAADRWLADNP